MKTTWQPAIEYRKKKRVEKIIYIKECNLIAPKCPTCDGFIEREYMNYCSNCGQALSWHRYEEVPITRKLYVNRKNAPLK